MVFFEILGFAFVVALTGAMSPGPVLTYTIYKSIQAGKKSYLTGIYICLGHAILEFFLILVLLGGMAPYLSEPIVIKIIGVLGGGLLIFLGFILLKDIVKNNIDYSFLEIQDNVEKNEVFEEELEKKYDIKQITKHPIVGGLLISMSNPYWWLWWAVIGLAFMTNFSINFTNFSGFWAFFIGHELGDIIWYVPIATLTGMSHKFMNKKVYIIILIACAFFMIGFGLYLSISPFFS